MTCGSSPRQSLSSSKIALILGLTLLGGCSTARPVAVPALEVERPEDTPALPLPQPIETQSFKWTLVVPGRLPPGDDWVLFALAPEDYERLALNQAEALRWIREAMFQLQYYRKEP
jgi:hypothetical protein